MISIYLEERQGFVRLVGGNMDVKGNNLKEGNLEIHHQSKYVIRYNSPESNS